MLKHSDAAIDWALDQLSLFEYMEGYPKRAESLELVAKGFLDIVYPQPICYEDRNDDPERGPERVIVRDEIPMQDAADALMRELAGRFTKFPPLIKIRACWEGLGYSTADGKNSGEMGDYV